MAAGGSKYFQIAPARRRDTGGDVNRGLQVGQEVGKLLGGLAGAIKGAQKDALANKLMTDEAIGDQPGAGVTQSLGKLGDDTGSAATSDGEGGGSTTPIDLGTAPIDQTFTNPSTGNVEPVQQTLGESDNELQKAMTASRLQSSAAPITSTLSDDDLRRAMAGGPQPNANPPTTQATTSLASGGTDFSLNPSDYSSGGTAFGGRASSAGTVGGLIHTGGTQELDLQKEILAMRLQKQGASERVAAAQAKAADEAAQAAGTGKYAMAAALKRAQLEKAQLDLQKAREPKIDKNAIPENITEQPVTDQNQLINHINSQYKGSASGIFSSVSEQPKIPDPNHPDDPSKATPNPNYPIISGDSVTIPTGKNKVITMPLVQLQAYVKQQNSLNIRHGLSALRVPGEDLNIGRTRDNPYPTKNDLDVASRAPGTWVTLPDGTLAQVPERKRP